MGQIKIGVTAATGQLGRKVIENLKQTVAADQIVALVRNPEKAQDFGVEVRALDYNKPEQIENSLKGIDRLLLISSNEFGKRYDQHKNVIDSAKKAGVQSLAYTSVLRADVSKLALAPDHKQTEEYLKSSGLNYTFLRNGWYIENYTANIDSALETGAVYGSAGNGKISAASRNDFARAAVKVLTTDGHNNKIYELGGNAFSLSTYAETIAKESGKDIKYVNLPEEDFSKALESAGLPTPMAQLFASIDTEISKGELETDSKDLTNLIGNELDSLDDEIKIALKK